MKYFLFVCTIFVTATISAQSNLNDLLSSGLEDAEQFTGAYLAPVSEAAIYSIGGNWYNSAEAKPPLGFEISIIGNMTPFKNKIDKKTFVLNTADYENLRFTDGSVSKVVSTALGDIRGIDVYVESEVAPGVTQRADFELPSGLAAEDINFIPSGFVQVSIGIFKATELKARFLPKINTDEVSVGFYGFGLQHEFTSHLPADNVWPVAISGIIGYTHLDGTYDFTSTDIIDGQNQRIHTNINTWNFEAAVSTRLPVINFYAGLGYLSGSSNTDILGTYQVQSGPFQQSYVDPFSLSKKAGGVCANLGVKLKLGFFRLHADYSVAEFNNLSVGLNFGFR